MTVIRGGTDDEIRAQVAEAGGTERDADVVIGFARFLRTAGQPPRPDCGDRRCEQCPPRRPVDNATGTGISEAP